MNEITSALIGLKVYYTDIYNDGKDYPVSCFGVVDSVTVDANNNSQYLTIKDNKGMTTNFSYTHIIKKYNLIALPFNRLQSIPHERFMQSLYR